MQTLFSVAAKLLGLLVTYWGLTNLLIAFLGPGGPHAPALNVVSAIIAFAFGFLLMFRTDWLARRVGVHADPTAALPRFESLPMLRTGIVLIGLYVFLVRLAIVLSFVYVHLSRVQVEGLGQSLLRAVIESIPLAIALVFVFRADRIAALISGSRAQEG